MNVVELREVEPGKTALASEQSIKVVPGNSQFSNLASRWFVAGLLATALVISLWIWIKVPLFARALAIAGICLTLWLTEVVPPYVPPNAMIYGEGGITFSDLAVPGLILMVLGCVLVSTTGPLVLKMVGIP